MATVLFGIAFAFGASEIWYQLRLHGSAEAYFAQMSLGKLIAFTHAHLFGFTTSFFIIGIPFSLQFNHLWPYQWVFPIGLSASFTDVASWWGIKFLSPNFEWVSIFCGVLFSLSYLYMLVGLLRVLLFPDIHKMVWEKFICNVAYSGICTVTGMTVGEAGAQAARSAPVSSSRFALARRIWVTPIRPHPPATGR